MREQRASRISLIRPSHPKMVWAQKFYFQMHPLIPGHLAGLSGSPEKAGVGGSIPSLATILFAVKSVS